METLWIALPIFFVIYSGVGMLLEKKSSRPAKWEKTRATNEPSALRKMTRALGASGLNKTILKNEKYHQKLDLLLMRSGYAMGWSPEDLLFYKELGVAFAAFFMWQMEVTNPLIWIAGLYFGFWLPQGYIKAKASARQAEIQRLLPACIDLLTLTLEGGLDFMAAIEKILAKMKPNALRDELQTTLQESRLGTPRKEALQHLAHRTDSQEVQSFTSMIIQSEELGTSLAVVLRTYAEDMRARRILRAEELAGKIPVKLILPMFVFFFPIVFVVILGPLALSLMSSYK